MQGASLDLLERAGKLDGICKSLSESNVNKMIMLRPVRGIDFLEGPQGWL